LLRLSMPARANGPPVDHDCQAWRVRPPVSLEKRCHVPVNYAARVDRCTGGPASHPNSPRNGGTAPSPCQDFLADSRFLKHAIYSSTSPSIGTAQLNVREARMRCLQKKHTCCRQPPSRKRRRRWPAPVAMFIVTSSLSCRSLRHCRWHARHARGNRRRRILLPAEQSRVPNTSTSTLGNPLI